MLALERRQKAAQRQTVPSRHSVMGPKLHDFIRSLQRRWQLYRMQSLEDHLLDDIGVTREELEWAIRLPLSTNAALALRERAARRRMASTTKNHRC